MSRDDDHGQAGPAGRKGRGSELAAIVLYGLVTLAVSYAVAKPDQLAQWAERIRARPPMPAREARARRLIAELRADLAAIERGM